MSRKKTYIDSGVLISAFCGIQSISIVAHQILNDENLEFASSRFVQLEVLPKATFNKQQGRCRILRNIF
ncbi:hypothetical protein [Nostoc sp.]|uniref:hypothetical protein n=1 Tax=Nostoc sp. TaxID=1180 RepID=UPI002FF9940E